MSPKQKAKKTKHSMTEIPNVFN